MFFGLELKSNQAQAKPTTLEAPLKLSQAVLDPSKNGKKEPVCVMAEYGKKQFILCVLDPSQSWQSPLDLMFEAGSEVKFFLRGSGTVHLTGYHPIDDLDDMEMCLSDDEISDLGESDVDDESEEEMSAKPKAKAASKTVAKVSEKPVTKRQLAKRSQPFVEVPSKSKDDSKKGKKALEVESTELDDNDDDESDDEDYDASNQVDENDSNEDMSDEDMEDEDDADIDEEESDDE